MLAWEHAGLSTGTVPQVSVLDLSNEIAARPGEIQVLDVRRAPEWETGHIAQARHKPLHKLRSLIGDLDPQRPIAVHCKSGYRSSIATSLLLRAGFKNVINVTGGFDAWAAQKLPVVQEETATSGASGCVAEQAKR
jgi:hydroxyacylglutathione hydrolase